MSGAGVRPPLHRTQAPLTRPAAPGSRLPDAPVARPDEGQAEGRPNRPRPAQAQERGPHKVRLSVLSPLADLTARRRFRGTPPPSPPAPPRLTPAQRSPAASTRPSARWAASCRWPPSRSPRSRTPSAATSATRSRKRRARRASACARARRTSRACCCPPSTATCTATALAPAAGRVAGTAGPAATSS
jgi:hypothetical protein